MIAESRCKIMKKAILILSALLAFSLFFNLVTPIKKLLISGSLRGYVVINDEETALKYAEVIIRAVYDDGENNAFARCETYDVSYDKFFGVWRVIGILPENTVGGAPSVIFDKNGRIWRVLHTYG